MNTNSFQFIKLIFILGALFGCQAAVKGDNPDDFPLFKYLGYGIDVTRTTLNTEETEHDFTTNLLEPIYSFKASGRSYRLPATDIEVPLPDFIDPPMEYPMTSPRTNIFDKLLDYELLLKPEDDWGYFPLNYSQQYLQDRDAANNRKVGAQTSITQIDFFAIAYRDLEYFSPAFVEAAKATGKIDGIRDLLSLKWHEHTFNDFFRRFGTHFSRQMYFGERLRLATHIEPEYFHQNLTRNEAQNYLEVLAYGGGNSSLVPQEFTEHSCSVVALYGNLSAKTVDSIVPVGSVIKPIYELLKEIPGVTNLAGWKLALDLYLFNYKMRSIKEIVRYFKADVDNSLKSLFCDAVNRHLIAAHGESFLKQYIELKHGKSADNGGGSGSLSFSNVFC